MKSLRNKHIIILMGGPSSEAEISRRTAQAIYTALASLEYNVTTLEFNPKTLVKDLEEAPCDIVFNAVHGKYGEDGHIAAVLDMLEIPYTGCSVLASALTMDKIASKHLFRSAGINTPRSLMFYQHNNKYILEQIKSEIIDNFTLPVVIKAASQGSSIGVEIVESTAEIETAIHNAFKYDQAILVEEFIDGMELSVPVYGNEIKRAWPVIEITTTTGRYDYHTKYTQGQSTHIIPARISPETNARVQELACKACAVAHTNGVVRVDIMLSKDNEPYVLEINTIPGMTNTSLVPDSASKVGISFPRLCEMILEMIDE